MRIGAGVLSLLPVGLGWLWILIDRDKRAWHDRLSHTALPSYLDALVKALTSPPQQGAGQQRYSIVGSQPTSQAAG
jgi:hypothetical protein